jgi:hypothetical protein
MLQETPSHKRAFELYKEGLEIGVLPHPSKLKAHFTLSHDNWCNAAHGGEFCTCNQMIIAKDYQTEHTYILVDKRCLK